MTPSDVGKAAVGTVEALKSQPLALALVVVNILFLGFSGWYMNDVSKMMSGTAERKDQLINQLLEQQHKLQELLSQCRGQP